MDIKGYVTTQQWVLQTACAGVGEGGAPGASRVFPGHSFERRGVHTNVTACALSTVCDLPFLLFVLLHLCICAVCSNSTLPPLPTNATSWSPSCNGLAPGETCTAQCAANYTGSPTATCGANGTFLSPANGTCTPNTTVGKLALKAAAVVHVTGSPLSMCASDTCPPCFGLLLR